MTEPALDPEAAPRDEASPVRDESVPPRAPSAEPPRAPAGVSNRERAITFWIAAGCVIGALFLGRAWGAHDAQGPAPGASSDAEPAAPAVNRSTDPMTLGLDALYTRRDPVAAAARFREVLLGNPEHYGATFQLATALDQAGDTRSARPLWEKMITMAQAAGDPKSEGIARARVAAIDAGTGDERTFQSLVQAWSPMMLRLAGGYVGSTATAEEVVQETWLAVIRGLDKFEERSSLRTWVLRICVNQAKRHGVRESRIQPSGMPSADAERTVEPSRFRPAGEEWAGYWTPEGQPSDWGPEAHVLTGEVREILVEAVQALPPRQAQVVALRDVHGLDSAEVADLVGISEGNVRVLLHRGRAALRLRLEDFYRDAGRVG